MANETPDMKREEFYAVGPLRGKILVDPRTSRWRGKHKLLYVLVTAPDIEGYGAIERTVRIFPGKRHVGHGATIDKTYATKYNEVELHELAEKVTSEAVTRLGRFSEKIRKPESKESDEGFLKYMGRPAEKMTSSNMTTWREYADKFYTKTSDQLLKATGVIPKARTYEYGNGPDGFGATGT